jgi:D-alanyl-lipoteichoic acid acyltransferase DltB (MBOAT superfamily)
MNAYSIALFLHIVGALGIAIALGLEWIGLSQIRNALLPEQVRPWMMILKNTNKVGFLSMLTAVITGAYMMLTVWGGVAWLYVTLGSLILVILFSAALTRPRMMAIGQALAMGKGTISQTFHNLVNQPVLWLSIQTRSAIVLGIIFLKIVKPDLGGSLLTIGVAIFLGFASALPFPRRQRAGVNSAD